MFICREWLCSCLGEVYVQWFMFNFRRCLYLNKCLGRVDIYVIIMFMFRECSEEDELVYDALLQQWFTLVNKKNTLIRLEFSLIIESEQNKKICMLEIFKKKNISNQVFDN